ncbi:MAG: hypothetical protein HC773_26580 [Scytonema sp. CRU_2_7]|nr:hypothetical protein [Scytonema sp. CRU_2_7]
MNIEIIEARPQDQSILSHLIELYLYDFSEFMGWDVGNDGRFGDDGLKGCWTEPWRHPFLVKVDARSQGLSLPTGAASFQETNTLWTWVNSSFYANTADKVLAIG